MRTIQLTEILNTLHLIFFIYLSALLPDTESL